MLPATSTMSDVKLVLRKKKMPLKSIALKCID